MSEEPEWEDVEEHELNLWALAGMTVSTLVAMVSLFVVPMLEGAVLTLIEAFALLCVIEAGAALAVVAFLGQLHTDREYETE